MKYSYMVMMIMALFSLSISANTYYHSLCCAISDIGISIENVNNVPVVGKLTNVLPLAVLAISLKKYPMQTMMVLASFSGYLVFHHSMIQERVKNYTFTKTMPWIKKINNNKQYDVDEDLFVFDGDDDSELRSAHSFDSIIDDTHNNKNKSAPITERLFL